MRRFTDRHVPRAAQCYIAARAGPQQRFRLQFLKRLKKYLEKYELKLDSFPPSGVKISDNPPSLSTCLSSCLAAGSKVASVCVSSSYTFTPSALPSFFFNFNYISLTSLSIDASLTLVQQDPGYQSAIFKKKKEREVFNEKGENPIKKRSEKKGTQ